MTFCHSTYRCGNYSRAETIRGNTVIWIPEIESPDFEKNKRLLIVLKFYRLNHNSSRSHCIFTVKMVRVADKDQPHMARVSMLSFCDLAGSERIKKTMNTGDRQKEAGNINTSLLVLGRCIKAIRHNQMIKDVRKHQIIPYRDSKLTRLFQSYFTGCGKVSMIVNISQSSYLFDEVSTFHDFVTTFG